MSSEFECVDVSMYLPQCTDVHIHVYQCMCVPTSTHNEDVQMAVIVVVDVPAIATAGNPRQAYVYRYTPSMNG
jgi:hypothetical protein